MKLGLPNLWIYIHDHRHQENISMWFHEFFLYGKSAKAYLRIGCTYCRSGRWTTPNKSLDVEGQTVNEHIQANHTIKHFVELIPPHFATTYRDSIQPYVVSLFCLFAHPNHFLQVSIQIYLVDQKPKVLEKKETFYL